MLTELFNFVSLEFVIHIGLLAFGIHEVVALAGEDFFAELFGWEEAGAVDPHAGHNHGPQKRYSFGQQYFDQLHNH